MQENRKTRWLAPWRRRKTTAWGSLLDEQEILLAGLSMQQSGNVRVLVFEQVRAPQGLSNAAARDDWLVQTLRIPGQHLPARLRTMAIALREGRCHQGTLLWSGPRQSRVMQAEVQIEAATALGVDPGLVGFDFHVEPNDTPDSWRIHWAACLRSELEQWQRHALSAGWRLPVVEPEQQAARRAAMCLREDPTLWAGSPQDWQFSRTPERELSLAQWQHLLVSPMWGPLVACGAALGALA